MPRIEKELQEGDSLNTYLLRNGEKWVFAYLESRQIPALDLVYAIRKHAGILETDLIKSCDELLTLPPLFDKLAATKKATEGGFWDLCMKIVDWQKKPSFQANSSLDGLGDDMPVTAGQMRSAIREMSQRGQTFNKWM
jgi:hypothetical protein